MPEEHNPSSVQETNPPVVNINNDNYNETFQNENPNKTIQHLDRITLIEIQLEQTEEKLATVEKEMQLMKLTKKSVET